MNSTSRIFRLLLAAMLLVVATVSYGQTIQGGGGVCHVNGNPNSVPAMETQDIRSECLIAIDTTTDTRIWYYKHDETAGSRWQLIDLQTVTDTDTRMTNPRVSNDTLLFDVLNVKTSTVTGTEFVLIGAIAPVQSVAAGTGISVSTTAGVATVTNTAPDQTVAFTPSTGITATGTYPNFTLASTGNLLGLNGLSTVGFIARTGTNTFAERILSNTSTIIVTNGNGVGGAPGFSLAQQGATTGQILKWNGTTWLPANDENSGGTVTSVGLSAATAALSITNTPVTGAGTINIDVSAKLNALQSLAGTGIVVQTDATSFAARTITGGTGISVTNGNGVAGNITITNDAPNVNQTLSISGQDLTISAGNTVTLPSGSNIYNANGTLTGERTVTQGANRLIWNSAVDSDYAFNFVNGTATGLGMFVSSVSTRAFQASATGDGSQAVIGSASGALSVGVLGTSNNDAGVGMLAQVTSGSNQIRPVFETFFNKTSPAANNGLEWYITGLSSTGVKKTFGTHRYTFTDVVNGTEDADWSLRLVEAGTVGPKLTVVSTGQATLNEYGAGAFTGTATKWLAVTSAGAVIEMDAPSGTTDLTFTGASAPYTLNSSSGTNVTFNEGAGIELSRTANELTVDVKTVSALNHADAAANGVAVGEFFYAAQGNTLGAATGTLLRRAY